MPGIPRLRLLPLAFTLCLGLSGCLPGEDLVIEQPRPGGLLGPDVPFVVTLPGRAEPTLYLDGEILAGSHWARSEQRLEGSLTGLAPGPHALRVTYPRFGDLDRFPWFRWLHWIVRQQYGVDLGPPDDETTTSFEVGSVASYQVRGSLEQLFVTGADPGQPLVVYDTRGERVAEGQADAQGSLIFRELAPFDGYAVATAGAPFEISPPVAVRAVAGSTPPQAFYDDQVLEPGFGYLTMRDGTKLSVYVQMPGPPEEGPYPTLVNYSGYAPSQPAGSLPIDLDLSAFCGQFPVLCDPPNHPSGLIGGVLGFATVGVNMRGTGCSGGAYDFFEPLQITDGYDVIEAVAAQDWVAHHHVGMAGISFPGISQLFTASARPPSLAAITPLSVISGADTTLAPGGILNDGFAVEWATQVLDRADPYGQGWEQGQVDAGDTICEENQLLHSQKVDIIQKALDNPFYTPEVYDPLNPRTFVDRIEVPVFTVGQWQDEQTGGHFPDLWTRFTNAPLVRFTGMNGAHADGYAPQILAEWKYFLDFYVTREVRDVPPLIRGFAPFLFQEIFGAPAGLPAHRFLGHASFEEALAAYEAEPPGRILFENGGDPAVPGAPEARFELALSEWPPPETEAQRWYLQEDGSLSLLPPAVADSASVFQHDNGKGGETYAVNGAFERAGARIEWLPWQPGRQAVWLTEPLLEDLTLLGHASADLYIQSTAEDADLEVTISEVRPDGQESYVTSGWLRASRRKLDPAESTELKPRQTHREADAELLPPGRWELVRVEIYPFAHVFRAGSQLRVAVSTPGGNKGRWKFDVLQFDEPVTHAISHSAAFPSSLVLPAIPGLVAPVGLPVCPSVPEAGPPLAGLRSQFCRDHEPHTNALLD